MSCAAASTVETNDIRELAADDTWIAEQPGKVKATAATDALLAVISIDAVTGA